MIDVWVGVTAALRRFLCTALGTALCGLAMGGTLAVSVPVHDGVAEAKPADPSEAFISAKGKSRTIRFTTDQGTLMSLDVSPDGRHIIFDLLGHIYRMDASGGRAECLTQGSGIALNYHPRFSPDGRQIAFISDRSGQANVWIMRADGTEPRTLYLDADHRYATPVWSADGQSLFVTRLAPTPGQGWHRRNASIWHLPMHGTPHPILTSTAVQYYVASGSRDGRTLYVYSSEMARAGASIYEVGFHIQALTPSTGNLIDVATSPPARPPAASPPALAPRLSYDLGDLSVQSADILPMASPDGRYLAFAHALSTEGVSFRGHRYQYSTALFILDLKSGMVRKVLDPATKDVTNGIAHYSDTFLPGYAWTPDSRELIISVDGKIKRVSSDGLHVKDVPFEAKVLRAISGQVRRQAHLDPDDAVPVRFIQWPTASPDGRHLVFVALGRLWMMDLPNGEPRPLTGDPKADVQITPAWARDGTKVAFATWNERDRGQIWILDLQSGRLTKLSTEAGEYIWPTWTPDGDVVAVRGPGAPDTRDAWNEPSGWNAVRLSRAAVPVALTPVSTPWQPLQIDQSGRIYFASQWERNAANRASLPYPDALALEFAAWNVVSVDASGSSPRVHVAFPAGPASANVPVVSEDGAWIAYQADYQLFAEKLTQPSRGPAMVYINPDPTQTRPGRQRADEAGGVYARWHDSHTLEFAAGNSYVTFDVMTGARHTIPVALQFPRDRNPESFALRNARIITMEGDQVIQRGTVIVRNGRFACVGACSEVGVTHVMDLSGKTIIPGLIDVHDHISDEPSGVVPRRRPKSLLPLAYGVTTVIDPAVSSMTLFPLAEMTDAGLALGPRTFGAAEPVVSSVGGSAGVPNVEYGASVDIRNEADAEYQVARRAAWGAVTIKNYRQTNRQQQQWLIEAARRHGLSVTAEGSSVLADLSMIMDGQTGWEHFLPTLNVYRDLVEFLGRAHATYSPTLSVAGFPEGAMFYYRRLTNLSLDPKYRRFASASLLSAVQPGANPQPLEQFAFPILAEGAADVVRAGGFSTIGEHGENPGIGSHWEIWAYASAMTPMEALRAATLFGARFDGLDHELGSLAVGKYADLVVLNGDPMSDIRKTADMAYVMKAGHLYDASSLTEIK